MLAHPTPAQAFANRYTTIATYLAQHPSWYQWGQTGSTLWAAAPTLDPAGLTIAVQMTHRAAWVLDGLLTAAPASVGLWRTLAPAVTGAWETWQQIALQAVNTVPSQTLRLTPAAQNALQSLVAWDPIRQHNTPPDPESALVAVLQGVSLIASTPVPPSGAPQVRYHTLTDQDTLLGLARHYLQDPEAWPTIRQLNRLRAPYLSARLWDVYGPPIIAYTLTNSTTAGDMLVAPLVAQGALQVVLPNVPPPLCPPGSVLVLEQWTSAGRQQESHIVQAYDGNTFTATITTPTTAAYTPGAFLSLNFNPQILTTQVLMPGQAIQIPLPGSLPSAQLPVNTDPWGTDLYLTPSGDLQQTSTGDVQTATGIQNLQGALSRRLQAYLGTVPLHRSYGSGLPTVIGRPMVHPHVVQAYVRTALLPDPRVQDVNPVTVTQDGTIWRIVATVIVQGLPAPLTIAATLGG